MKKTQEYEKDTLTGLFFASLTRHCLICSRMPIALYRSTIQSFHMIVGRSRIDHAPIEWSRIVFETASVRADGSFAATVGQSGLPLTVVLGVIAVLVVVGIGVTVVRLGGLTTSGSTDRSGGEPTEPEPADTAPSTGESADTASTVGESVDAAPATGDSVGAGATDTLSEQTLDRLESVVPAAVGRARSQPSVEWSTSDLRGEIEDAIAAGRLDPAVSSPFDGSYEIVNLPKQYRELTLPVSGETVHIADLESVARETVATDPPRDVARTIAAIDDHCQRIESHIEDRQAAFLDEYHAIEETVQDVRELTDRFDGSFGSRLSEFVIEGRHEALSGIVDIERRLADARRDLHRAAFDDAMRSLESTAQTADELLMAVDFLGGVVGTIDHGGGRVPIPDAIPTAVLSDLVPLVEQQHDATLEITDGTLVVTVTPTADSSDPEPTTESFEPEPDPEPSTHEQVTPEAVADEVLFLFRELDADTDTTVVECQTEQLPAAVGRPEILSEVVSFCHRQPDIVETVTLQDDAPPGFLEIEFTDRAGGENGLETLRDRYATKHGSS